MKVINEAGIGCNLGHGTDKMVSNLHNTRHRPRPSRNGVLPGSLFVTLTQLSFIGRGLVTVDVIH